MDGFLTFALKYLPYLLSGALVTAQITAGSFALAMVFGLIGALAKASGRKAISFLASAYVEVIRGTPALLQIFVVYYGLASYGLSLSPIVAAVLTFGVIGGAYVTEIIRAGIEAVDRGQIEAATSLGMAPRTILQRIILPQAAFLMLPPFTNFLISLVKDTSLALVVTVPELMYRTYDVASQTFRSMEIYAVAGAIYFAICFPLSRFAKYLERKRAPR